MAEPTSALAVIAQKAAEIVIPESMRRYFAVRSKRALEVLIEELRTAKVDPDEAAARDEVAAMFVKFYHAMAQGAAFANLRVMAKILAGKPQTHKNRLMTLLLGLTQSAACSTKKYLFSRNW